MSGYQGGWRCRTGLVGERCWKEGNRRGSGDVGTERLNGRGWWWYLVFSGWRVEQTRRKVCELSLRVKG
jgi:hypothetical protein